MLLLQSAASARNISSPYISRYIYRTGYVLAFKRGCYWIMNVPKRPKFRMRGKHYFRHGSNNFVRFYITRLAVSAALVYRLQRVPHVEKCIRSTVATRTAYVTGRAVHLLLLSKFSLSQKQLRETRDAYYLVNLKRQNVKISITENF